MAFKVPEQTKVSAEAYIKTSQYTSAENAWDEIHQGIRDYSCWDYEEEYPSYVYDQNVYKVTVIVEKV